MEYKDCFYKFLPELSSAVAKCLADDYDEIKNVTIMIFRQHANLLRN